MNEPPNQTTGQGASPPTLYFNDPFGHRQELTAYAYDESKRELKRLAEGAGS